MSGPDVHSRSRRRRWTCGVALVSVVALGACNVISGADEIVLGELSDDDDDDGPPIVGVGGGTSSGAGGESSTSSTSTSTSSSTSTSTSTSTSSSSTSTSTSSSTSSSSTTSSGCTYPAGPYGVAVNATLSPSLSWQGYDEGPVGQVTTIALQDYFDCDGSKGINALMVETSQYG